MTEWQPIESAPKDGTVFDAWCPCEGLAAGGFRVADVIWEPRYEAFFTDSDGILGNDLTHWMPLPAPPPPPKGSIKFDQWKNSPSVGH